MLWSVQHAGISQEGNDILSCETAKYCAGRERKVVISMKEIKKWIREQEGSLIQDLRAWIAIPSVSRKGNSAFPFGEECARMLDTALAWSRDEGMRVQNFDYYCGTALWQGQTDSRIGIITHLDVVPEGEGWTGDPYQARVQDGTVIGRGSADDKGPALAALYALRFLREQGVKLRHSVCVYYGCSEETGMEDIEYYLSKETRLPVFSLVPDARLSVCHGEKGKLDVLAFAPLESRVLLEFSAGTAENCVPSSAQALLALPVKEVEAALKKGKVPFQVREEKGKTRVMVEGKAAHAAFPDGAVPAQRELAALLCDSGILEQETERVLRGVQVFLEDFHGKGLDIPYETPEFGKLTHVSGLTSLENGYLSLSFDIRYPGGISVQEMKDRISARLEQYGFRIGSWKNDPSYYVDPELPVIRRLQTISEEVWNRSLPAYVMGGGTYARKLPNAVPYGPGLPRVGEEGAAGRGSGHQPDEAVSLEVLEKGIEIYARALQAVDELAP